MWRKYFPCNRHIFELLFLMLWNSNEDTPKTLLWKMVHMNAFVSTCAVAFYTTQGQNKTRRFDTEGFVSVASLCGIVGSLYWFTKCLIGRTGNIWSVVYTNERCIYPSETRACTILECEIVRNVCHVNSTWPLVSPYHH